MAFMKRSGGRKLKMIPDKDLKKAFDGINNSSMKIRNLKLVWRGGNSIWPSYSTYSEKKHQRTSVGNSLNRSHDLQHQPMQVDSPYKDIKNPEDWENEEEKMMHCHDVKTSGIMAEPHFSQNDKNSRSAQRVDEKQKAITYIDIIQSIQRKRKFKDISKPDVAVETGNVNNSSLSRRERLIYEIHKTKKSTGHRNGLDQNASLDGNSSNIDFSGWNNPESEVKAGECNPLKRLKKHSEYSSLEPEPLVDLNQVRREYEEHKRQHSNY